MIAEHALTPDTYYQDLHFMSASRLKGYLECQARQHAIDTGVWVEEPTDAMLAGSYVHAAVEGTLEQFKSDHPEMFKKDGELKAQFAQADNMAHALMADSFIRSMLVGQHEQIITQELFGIPWKAKIDVLHPARVVDVKTVRSLSEREWKDGRYQSWVEARGYLRQLAIYAELVKRSTGEGEWRQPLIIACTKEDPCDKAIIAIDDATIADELHKVSEVLPDVMSVVRGDVKPTRCEKCGYCRNTKQVTRILQWQELIV